MTVFDIDAPAAEEGSTSVAEAIYNGISRGVDTAEIKDGLSREKLSAFWDSFIEFCTTKGVDLLIALVVLFVGFYIVKRLTKHIRFSKRTEHLDPSVRTFFASFVSIGGKILIVITVCAIMGVPMSSVVAIIGSIGLAIGLALQGALANIAGGFVIMAFKPFKVGDYITANGDSGTVTDIGLFYTKIQTLNNSVIIVPNSTISNQTVKNDSAMPVRRYETTFSAAYGCDVDKVCAVLLKTASENAASVDAPAPNAFVSSHSDSAVIYTVQVWCRKEDYLALKESLAGEVKKAFDAEGIEIPFPQRVVHIDKP